MPTGKICICTAEPYGWSPPLGQPIAREMFLSAPVDFFLCLASASPSRSWTEESQTRTQAQVLALALAVNRTDDLYRRTFQSLHVTVTVRLEAGPHPASPPPEGPGRIPPRRKVGARTRTRTRTSARARESESRVGGDPPTSAERMKFHQNVPVRRERVCLFAIVHL